MQLLEQSTIALSQTRAAADGLRARAHELEVLLEGFELEQPKG